MTAEGPVPPHGEPTGETAWDGDAYQRRFDRLAASGTDVHGEADLVARLGPSSVLDAGCGTGRVAAELHRRGIDVVGIDRDASMIRTARALAPDIEFAVLDVVDADLGRTFDLVVMAGNVPLFTPAGSQGGLVAGCARHLAVFGRLLVGFQLGRGYLLEQYDDHCRDAGLVLEERWSTWGRDPFTPDADYAVSLHRRRT
ncbi:MAG: class I SAM-dependent methyltransferase [Acidimicrobiales bacterium]|jgi:SAM-dependent methyltransferase